MVGQWIALCWWGFDVLDVTLYFERNFILLFGQKKTKNLVMEVSALDISFVTDHHYNNDDRGACQRCDHRRLLLGHSSRHTSSLAFAHKQVERVQRMVSSLFPISATIAISVQLRRMKHQETHLERTRRVKSVHQQQKAHLRRRRKVPQQIEVRMPLKV